MRPPFSENNGKLSTPFVNLPNIPTSPTSCPHRAQKVARVVSIGYHFVYSWESESTEFPTGTWMSRWKLGWMVSKWIITCLKMGYLGVITHLLTVYEVPGTFKKGGRQVVYQTLRNYGKVTSKKKGQKNLGFRGVLLDLQFPPVTWDPMVLRAEPICWVFFLLRKNPCNTWFFSRIPMEHRAKTYPKQMCFCVKPMQIGMLAWGSRTSLALLCGFSCRGCYFWAILPWRIKAVVASIVQDPIVTLHKMRSMPYDEALPTHPCIAEDAQINQWLVCPLK